MATTEELAAGARGMLRDFPKYFEISEGPLNVLTIRLPHPLISLKALQVNVVADDVVTPTNEWTLDERNGLLKFNNESYLNKNVVVAGYYYTWFTDADLGLAMTQVASEQMYGRDLTIPQLSPVETEVLAIGTVVRALWSLSIDLALDIDVSTPEGMFIPAHQRYSQVVAQMQYWEQQYETRLGSLNVGMGALEQYRLRRVALTTGRYVPVYVDREFDDPRWPHRLYPEIPDGEPPPNVKPTWAKVREIEAASNHGIHYPAASVEEMFGEHA